ncbi:MAG: helix-turn-helix transcriptional regulator [Acidimicrobiia bacterium]
MSDPKTFGQAVRGARLARGMSMGQLATSVGRSTASVRRWERDEGVPAKGIIDELAAVLDLSDGDLALIWSEPDHFATPAPLTPPPATPAPATPAPATPAPATPAPATPAPATPAPLTPPPVTPLPQSGESQATQAAGSRVVAGVAVAEPEPAGIKGWLAELYDPANPWLGYLRATLTVIVLIILAWILVWALAELFGAVGEIWDGMWAEEV